MSQDQLNIIKNKILYDNECTGMDHIEIILYEKNNMLCLDINARDIQNENIWRGINIRVSPKSLDHVDRIIIAIKQLVKELE